MGRGHSVSRALGASAAALVVVHCAWSPPPPFLAPALGDAGPTGIASTPGTLVDASPSAPTPDDGGDPFASCATATTSVVRSPIAMLMVLDGSGSMNDDGKWTSIVPTLDAFIDDIAKRNDPTFGVGLTLFSDTLDPTHGEGPYPAMDVPIASVSAAQAAALHQRLDPAQPDGDTPTLAVLVGQYGALESFLPASPLAANAKKVLVLITDGVPYPNTEEQKQPAIDLAGSVFATAAPAGPITTFAVGVGLLQPYVPDVYDPLFMAGLALAGGDPNEPCDPQELTVAWDMCHFQVTPTTTSTPPASSASTASQLTSAIDRIRSKVTSCTLTIVPPDGGIIDPAEVNVRFTNSVTGLVSVIPEDALDGWTYDNPTAPAAILLHGDACTDLEDDPDGDIDVVLGCASVIK